MKIHLKYTPPNLADNFHAAEHGLELAIRRHRHSVVVDITLPNGAIHQDFITLSELAEKLMPEAVRDYRKGPNE